jgi:predicted membrane protein (TIGR00267 family)
MKSFSKDVAESIREIVFGLEDSLVSTLGALTGIAVGSESRFIVILAGLVLIATESTSMAAGSYLSSKSATDTEKILHGRIGRTCHGGPVRAASVMGVFYFVGGFIPLVPYALLDVSLAIVPSIVLTAASLFLIGVWASRYTKRSAIKSGLEMTTISLAAALIGYLIGRGVSIYFGVHV